MTRTPTYGPMTARYDDVSDWVIARFKVYHKNHGPYIGRDIDNMAEALGVSRGWLSNRRSRLGYKDQRVTPAFLAMMVNYDKGIAGPPQRKVDMTKKPSEAAIITMFDNNKGAVLLIDGVVSIFKKEQ